MGGGLLCVCLLELIPNGMMGARAPPQAKHGFSNYAGGHLRLIASRIMSTASKIVESMGFPYLKLSNRKQPQAQRQPAWF
jgi:hypothetical protein